MKNCGLIILLIVLFTIGCTREDILEYDSVKFIQFTKSYEDSTNISFMFFPGKNRLEIPISLDLMGMSTDANFEYKLLVDEENTTAEAIHFDLPENTMFRAGQYTDTCMLVLKKTADLKSHPVKLVLKLEGNEQVAVGQHEYSRAIIWISDNVSKPAWWVGDVVDYYLGEYSDTKFTLFIREVGVADLSKATESEIRNYSLKFKYYLQEMKRNGTPEREPDGTEITVPVLG